MRFSLMLWKKWTGLIVCSLVLNYAAKAQVTGGQHSFEYLRLSNSPQVTALGGMNVTEPDNDISLAMQNPALMRPALHSQLGLNYNAYYAGIKIMNLAFGFHAEKIQTSFALGVQYLNYGEFTQTDAAGNIYGNFKANDFAISVAAARSYGERWRYGMTAKFASSSLYDKSATALLADVGILYVDTANQISAGAVAKNVGFTVAKYNSLNSAEPLPFDLQLGFSKRFAHLPFRFLATLHHLYQWNIRYDNPADVVSSTLFGSADTLAGTGANVADKIFRHFTFGGQLLVGNRITATVSYNHLRRAELAVSSNKGLAGFAFGVDVDLTKVQVHYGRSYYHIAGAYNEIGFSFLLNKLMGAGRFGEKTGFNKQYADWARM